MALMAGTSAMAVTDGMTYDAVNGITCQNLWINSLYNNPAGWGEMPWMQDTQQAKARTACIGTVDGKDVVIVGYSKTMVVNDASNDYAHLVLIDFETGDVINTIQLTCDGAPIAGLLCANQVGCDNFGHVWVMGLAGKLVNEDLTPSPLTLYMVDDFETGACSKAAELYVNEDEAEVVTTATSRVDYSTLVGDITRKEARCTFMATTNCADSPMVVGWTCEQGSDEWEGAMDGYTSRGYDDTYPAGVTSWATAAMVRIILDDEYSNSNFYVDSWVTCPTIYQPSGAMIESFAMAIDLAPAIGTNGVGEFALGDKNFIAYSVNQYVAPEYCEVRVAELGENMSFDGMTSYWKVPEGGLGATSDGGNRIHSVETKVYTDANGKQGAYLLTYKCANGIGVYAISEEGWEGTDAVSDIEADNNNAPVEYFNLQGVRLSNPAEGQLVIRRQGNEVSKVLVK